MSHCVVTIHPGAAEHHGYRQSCTMKAQSHAAAWELSLNDEAISLTARTDSLRYPPVGAANTPRHESVEHPCHWLAAYLSPGAKRSSPRWCKACHSWTGPSGSVCGLPPPPGPPPCSASRAASTGDRRDCERFGAAAATRAPARADGVGGGRAIVMVMEGRRGERERRRDGRSAPFFSCKSAPPAQVPTAR